MIGTITGILAKVNWKAVGKVGLSALSLALPLVSSLIDEKQMKEEIREEVARQLNDSEEDEPE